MLNQNSKFGVLLGAGALATINLGWIPKYVKTFNLTDGDTIYEGFLEKVIPFTSGGTTTIAANDTITGATSGAKAKIREVLLVSGTWAGGDAAGWFLVDPEDITGTFGSENVYVGTGTNDATVTVQVEQGIKTTTAAASSSTNEEIKAYLGTSALAKGFTLGSTICESGKLIRWEARRE